MTEQGHALEERTEDRADEARESALAWKWRVLAVSAVWTMPGVLAGALVRLFVPDGGAAAWWMVSGAALGAILGGLLESDHLLG